MGTPGFSVRLDNRGDSACVEVTGAIDLATVDHLQESISLALTASQLSELLIDLGGVTFCDSTGLEVLVKAQRACSKRDVVLILRRPGDRLREIFKIAGL